MLAKPLKPVYERLYKFNMLEVIIKLKAFNGKFKVILKSHHVSKGPSTIFNIFTSVQSIHWRQG